MICLNRHVCDTEGSGRSSRAVADAARVNAGALEVPSGLSRRRHPSRIGATRLKRGLIARCQSFPGDTRQRGPRGSCPAPYWTVSRGTVQYGAGHGHRDEMSPAEQAPGTQGWRSRTPWIAPSRRSGEWRDGAGSCGQVPASTLNCTVSRSAVDGVCGSPANAAARPREFSEVRVSSGRRTGWSPIRR